jgi:hypothetical protein
MGSGKGAVLLYALDYPFPRIVGVELSERLHRVAQCNLERALAAAPAGRPRRVECLRMDVTAFPIPPEPVICYLSNPFKGKALDAVVANLRRSLAERPRGAAVVYYHPLSRHAAWDEAPFLRVAERRRTHTIYLAIPS